MSSSRTVTWGGIHNARDLGGLTGARGTTKFGRVFRMPRPDGLDQDGWNELEAAGVRTLVDLRNDDEIVSLPLQPPAVLRVHLPIEDPADEDFMAEFGEFLGTPTYYSENLRRWPQKITAVIHAVADAPSGGVVFHCSAGRDRTGLIAALILTIVGVDREDILDDYELGVRGFNDYLRSQPTPREPMRSDEYLLAAIADARASLMRLLESVDVESYLLASGLDASSLDRLRRRMLAP